MPGLEFIDIHKSFGAVRALGGVSFAVRRVRRTPSWARTAPASPRCSRSSPASSAPDRGEIRLDDRRLSRWRARATRSSTASAWSIRRCSDFPNLTVAGNIFAGREMTGTGGAPARARRCALRTRDLLARAPPVPSHPDARAESLSAAHRQLAPGRARARVRLPRPRARRADDGADRRGGRSPVPRASRSCKARGTTTPVRVASAAGSLSPVRFDHRHARRQRTLAPTRPRDANAARRVVRAMVGRDLPPRAEARRRRASTGAGAARSRGLVAPSALSRRIAARPRAGRSSALFGLVGSGRSELLETIFGLHAPGRRRGARRRTAPAGGRESRDRPRAPASRSCPRNASARDSSSTSSLRHNLMLPRAHDGGGRAVIANRGRAARSAAQLAAQLAHQGAGRRRDARQPERRQPAEGRARASGWRHRPTGPAARRADQGRRRRREVRDPRDHPDDRRPTGLACLVVSSDLPEVLSLCAPDPRHARRAHAGGGRRRRRRRRNR